MEPEQRISSGRHRSLERHDALARLAGADRFGGERRAGVEQGLAAALRVGRELRLLEREGRGEAGMGEGALDEAGGARPARRVGRETGIGRVAEEAGDGDVGEADLAEQAALRRQLRPPDNRARPGASSASVFSIRAASPGSPQTAGWTNFW